jgi:HD-GYP domain-containing protein (c-di-GMP phosphodiesterase class II)
LSVDYAVDEIERFAGKQFDPKLASIFVKLVRSGKLIIEPSRATNYPPSIQPPNIKA